MVSGNTHGNTGSASCSDEDNGPNDADPILSQVRWANSVPDHYIEGNYTVNFGYTLTIEAGCNIYFNGSFSIIVEGTLSCVGTLGSRITFTSNSSTPGPGNWSSLDFSGGGGEIQFCHIEYAEEGIHIDSVNPITIDNNIITKNVWGINGTHPDITLTNNNVSNNSESGIKIEAVLADLTISVTDNVIMDNRGGFGGIDISSDIGSITATLSGNDIINNTENGIFIFSGLEDIIATINDNNIEKNGYEGIFIIAEGDRATLNATILNNNLTSNYYGIWLTNNWMGLGTNITYNISHNKIQDNNDGIYVENWGPINAEVYNNNITNTTWGAMYSYAEDAESRYRVGNNELWNNIGGILIDYFYNTPGNRTVYAEITDNRIVDTSGSGIEIWSAENLYLTSERNEVLSGDYALYAVSFKNQTCSIHNNNFNDNFGPGVIFDSYDSISLTMTNNEVKNNWDYNFYLFTLNGGSFTVKNNDFSGSQNWDGVYFDYFKGSGIFEDNIVSDNAASGIVSIESRDIEIINSTFNNNLYGITCIDSILNITNSSISSISYDFNLTSNSHVIALNTSHDNSSVRVEDSESDLKVKWFLDVKVEDFLGFGVDDADVMVNDLFGVTEWSGNTGFGNNGWIKWIIATEYVQTSAGKNNTTPHNVSAQKGAESGMSRPVIWKSRNVTVVIKSKPVAIDISPHGGSPQSLLRNNTIFIHANCSDSQDLEDQLTPFFEYQDPNVSIWNTTYFSGPATYFGSPPSGYWTIPFSPSVLAPLGWYDLRVRFKNTLEAFSGFVYANDSVLVENNPPVVLDLTMESNSVFRTQSIYIYANGMDTEDSEDMLDAIFEYNDPEGTGWATDYLSAPTYTGGQWMVSFSPSYDAALGTYDFRVRFSDTTGDLSDFLYVYDNVEVKNNPPEVLDLIVESDTVFRTQSIYIYANGTDTEDSEDLLDAVFEYNDPEGTGWATDYLSAPTYTGGRWRITFSPSYDAVLGTYDFRVRFNDTAGDLSDFIYVYDGVEVKNNAPTTTNILISSSNVLRTETIFIYANGDDVEDSEAGITPHFECKESGSTIWTTNYLFEPVYVGGQWRINFTPSANALLSTYDFRIRFNDSALSFSEWIYENQSVVVNNNLPQADSISSSGFEVVRGSSLYIYANGSDIEDPENSLKTEFYYRIAGSGSWYNTSFSGKTYINEQWRIEFSPPFDMTLGDYEFRVGFYDSNGGFSNWLVLSGIITVQNSLPSVDTIDVTSSQIYRTESVVIYATGSDLENLPSDMTSTFQYKPSSSSTWNDLSGASYSYSNNRFEVSFTPSTTFAIGDYDFRVRLLDSDSDYSNWYYLNESLEVKNNIPSVLDLSLSDTEVFREDVIYLYANAQDDEKDEDDLIPTFEYSLDEFFWDTSYLGTPMYISGQWQVELSPPKDADLGDYSFRVSFSDGDDSSYLMYKYNALDIKNNIPTVNIDTSENQNDLTVSFSATVSDSEDSASSLSFLWDFGDGQTSSSESPTYTYDEPGDYPVTLTVTDKDDGTGQDMINITIEVDEEDSDSDGLLDSWEQEHFGNLNYGPEDDPDNDGLTNLQEQQAGSDPNEEDDGEKDNGTTTNDADEGDKMMMYLLLLVIIIVLVVLLVVMLLTRKKKKTEVIPPVIPAVAPVAQEVSAAPPVPPAEVAAPVVTPQVEQPQPISQPPPPVAAPPPPPAPPPPVPTETEPTFTKTIRCPKCKNAFKINLKKGPNTIKCPSCGVSGQINL
ncbi:MAG: right-handed parallel beta-helix repeat-containing protein [Thermoplasmata archaeon]|nr:MAG: right-handed parallel beta-helix repeat-containing protein [Thermoplasmata archaeon]